MEAHETRVQKLSDHVRSFHTRKEPFRVYHGGTTSTRRTVYHPDKSIDTSSFNHVLRIDAEKWTALVEPNVNMGKMVDATLPHGLVPLVVPEFESITVGGCFAGTGGESTSVRHGLFDDTISKIEIILADGTITTASETEQSDLLRGAAGSFGTLGVLVSLEVRLMPASKFVELEYHAVTDPASSVKKIEDLTEDGTVQYLDGILYGPQSGVVMAGRFTDHVLAGQTQVNFHRRRDEWFYLHAQKRLRKHQPQPAAAPTFAASTESSSTSSSTSPKTPSPSLPKDYITTRDYLFRYDRGVFWTAAISFKYFHIHNRRFQRWLLNPICKPVRMQRALHASGLINQYIVQDIAFPYDQVPDFVECIDGETGIWPLWLCPLYVRKGWPLVPSDETTRGCDRMINIGLWGQGSKKLGTFVEQNRRLEERTRQLHGMKCLYAQVFYSEEEFWSLYDREGYKALREKYGAEGLLDVYGKIGRNSAMEEMAKRESNSRERRKGRMKDAGLVRGLYGAAKMVLGGNYLMKKA